jgi:hypothetical protein
VPRGESHPPSNISSRKQKRVGLSATRAPHPSVPHGHIGLDTRNNYTWQNGKSILRPSAQGLTRRSLGYGGLSALLLIELAAAAFSLHSETNPPTCERGRGNGGILCLDGNRRHEQTTRTASKYRCRAPLSLCWAPLRLVCQHALSTLLAQARPYDSQVTRLKAPKATWQTVNCSLKIRPPSAARDRPPGGQIPNGDATSSPDVACRCRYR